jgi:hypothetical protein
MDDDRVIAIEIEHSDFEHRPVGCWPDQHRERLIHGDHPGCVADGVPDVSIGNVMAPRWLTDPP